MKLNLVILFAEFLASFHWNKMKAIAARTGKSHGYLMDYHKRYAAHSKKYNGNKEFLVEHGHYLTAHGMILDKQKTN